MPVPKRKKNKQNKQNDSRMKQKANEKGKHALCVFFPVHFSFVLGCHDDFQSNLVTFLFQMIAATSVAPHPPNFRMFSFMFFVPLCPPIPNFVSVMLFCVNSTAQCSQSR